MPKVSRETAANVDDHGIVEDRHEDFDGHTIQFLTFREDADGTPLMKGLPKDMCHSPHWGYVFKGRLTFRFADHEEVIEAETPSTSHQVTSRLSREERGTFSSAPASNSMKSQRT